VRGRALVEKGQLDEAKQAFNQVLQLNPKAAAAEVELARLHLDAGATNTSVALSGAAVKIEPGNVEARLVLARGLMARRDFLQAASILDELLRAAPGAAIIHSQVGLLHAMQNEAAAAVRAFDRALALDPFQMDALSGLTAIDLAAKREDAAIARLEDRLQRAPRNADVLMLAARARMATGQTAQAEAMLLRALDANPSALRAYDMLGRFYLGRNRLDAAREQFVKLAERQPKPVAALTMVGMIDQMQGRIQEARQNFERVMGLDPAAGVAANNLAWIYSETGSLDMALQMAQTATAALPKQPEVNDTLGWIYYKKDLLPLAIRSLRLSVEFDPRNPMYHYHLALAYAKSGNAAQARKSFETCLRLEPTFEYASDVRRRLEALRG